MGRRIILCVWTAALLCALLGLCHETGLKQAVDTNFKSGTGRYFCSPRRVSQSSSVDVKCKCISILNSWKNFNSKGRNYKVCKRLICFRGKNLFVAPSEWQKILQSITSDDLNLKYDLFAHYFLSSLHVLHMHFLTAVIIHLSSWDMWCLTVWPEAITWCNEEVSSLWPLQTSKRCPLALVKCAEGY